MLHTSATYKGMLHTHLIVTYPTMRQYPEKWLDRNRTQVFFLSNQVLLKLADPNDQDTLRIRINLPADFG